MRASVPPKPVLKENFVLWRTESLTPNGAYLHTRPLADEL
jgi:hypothetical protein